MSGLAAAAGVQRGRGGPQPSGQGADDGVDPVEEFPVATFGRFVAGGSVAAEERGNVVFQLRLVALADCGE